MALHATARLAELLHLGTLFWKPVCSEQVRRSRSSDKVSGGLTGSGWNSGKVGFSASLSTGSMPIFSHSRLAKPGVLPIQVEFNNRNQRTFAFADTWCCFQLKSGCELEVQHRYASAPRVLVFRSPRQSSGREHPRPAFPISTLFAFMIGATIQLPDCAHLRC